MFSYYGSKSKIVHYYPYPVHDTIVEPCAGAAWYSLTYPHKKVILNEKNKTIYDIWRWLIEKANSDELLRYSNFFAGDDISMLPICQEHKDFIGFMINRGSVAPKNIVQKWSCQVAKNPNWASTVNYAIIRAARLLPKIKHWKIIYGDYFDLPNIPATWFIDFPYQFGGEHYIENKIDFSFASTWIKGLDGQKIVCENTKANWMQFTPLVQITGQRVKTTEAIALF